MASASGTGAVARGGRIELALALLFSLALNLAYFDPRVVGINDTFYNFANFHIFYSELFFHGDLARWYPYGTYGLQADYEQIASLSPFSYLAGALGALFGVRDALLLFKLAAVCEQLVFVFGTWRLAGQLFVRRETVLLLALAAAGTTVWYAQQWWDLRIYAWLPLLLSYLFAFTERRRAGDLWRAGLVGVVWSLGSIPYWIPLWLLLLATVGGGAVRDWPATLRALVRQTPREWALFGLFAVLAGGYAWFVLHALDGTMLRAAERDPSGAVDLVHFRSYGGTANLLVVANALLFGWPLHLPWGSAADNSVYLGLLPVLGLGIAFVRERSRIFLALLAGAGVLVWLSLGSTFAFFVYYLPGMAFFRHVGLSFGLVKVLLLVASGFGLDRLFAAGGPRIPPALLWVGAAVIAVEIWVATPLPFGIKLYRLMQQWGSHFFARVGIYGYLLAASALFSFPRRTALALGLVLDLSLYQLAVHQLKIPRFEDAELRRATLVREPHFQPDRRELALDPARPETLDDESRASQRALDFARKTGSRELYWYVYQFAHFDPCRSTWRTDYRQLGADHLLGLGRAKGARVEPLLGCERPKLMVVADAHIARTPSEARDRVRDALHGRPAARPVLELAAGAEAPAAATSAAGEGAAGSARAVHFTLGELVAEVEVAAPGGAWLVYHDAYHEDWRASVNGVATPVHVANLAWKAVRVPAGRSEVRFWFHHGANHALGSAIAGVGLVAAAGTLAWIGASLARSGRREERGEG